MRKDGKVYTIELHKLVAWAWLEKPEGEVEVNHISGDKDDNSVDNLEWVSHRENVQKGFANGQWSVTPNQRHLYEITKDGAFVDYARTLAKAGEITGISKTRA